MLSILVYFFLHFLMNIRLLFVLNLYFFYFIAKSLFLFFHLLFVFSDDFIFSFLNKFSKIIKKLLFLFSFDVRFYITNNPVTNTRTLFNLTGLLAYLSFLESLY